MNKFLKLLFIILIVLGLFWAFKAKNFSADIKTTGIIKPIKVVTVGSTVSSLMIEVLVDDNSPVKKGQLIAKLDTSVFQAETNKANATLASAQANYIKQQAITNNDAKTYRRYKNLHARNLMAKCELDLAESTYIADRAALNSASAQITQAQADLVRAKTLMSFAQIYSPVDGVVIERKVNPGEPVAASYQEPELFIIATDLKKMQLEIDIPEAKIGQVKEGQKVKYVVDSFPNEKFEGVISQINFSPKKDQPVTTYTVIVPVDNENLKFKPGMRAKITIINN